MQSSAQSPKPRWLLAVVDSGIWVTCVCLAAVLRFDGDASEVPWHTVLPTAAAAAAGFVVMAALLHLYRGRHAVGSLDEALLLVMIAGIVVLTLTTMLALSRNARPVPLSVPLASVGTAVVSLVGVRVAYRLMRQRRSVGHSQLRAVVVGAGEAGTQLVRNLVLDRASPYDPICLVDDDPRKRHFRVGTVRVEGRVSDLPRVVRERRIERILIAAPAAGPELVKRVFASAAEMGVKAKALPSLAELAGHEDVGFRDLRDLQMSDFLRRAPVSTDLAAVSQLLRGRTVLVTGAGGSIGSELCRQVAAYEPARLFMLDRDESALHALQLTMDNHGLLEHPGLLLADIRDRERIIDVFADTRPDVVFHAAALKHLTLLQRYPQEALKTNILGTQNVLDAARLAGTEILVNISTDKAADPASMLGETKRVAERLTARCAAETGRRYLSVRFGNVLGSRGSVLTAFAEQIRNGGPVTVTHPDVTRFFMTVEEAVELVLQASALGEPADTLILDMGEPVRILDVAHQMIAMSGRSVDVVFTGLRAGEKLHEDLGGSGEVLRSTGHPLITRTEVPPLDPDSVPRLTVSGDGSLVIALESSQARLPS